MGVGAFEPPCILSVQWGSGTSGDSGIPMMGNVFVEILLVQYLDSLVPSIFSRSSRYSTPTAGCTCTATLPLLLRAAYWSQGESGACWSVPVVCQHSI